VKRQKKIYFGALLRFLTRARKEIERCAEARAYLGGCALIGAMTEYLLMTMLRMFPEVVYRRGRKVGEYWDLKRLSNFAKECGWFDQAVFDAAERIRRSRNLLHPNWYASRKPPRITRSVLTARKDDFQRVYDCIVRWVILRTDQQDIQADRLRLQLILVVAFPNDPIPSDEPFSVGTCHLMTERAQPSFCSRVSSSISTVQSAVQWKHLEEIVVGEDRRDVRVTEHREVLDSACTQLV
jgi:hypothetical protein